MIWPSIVRQSAVENHAKMGRLENALLHDSPVEQGQAYRCEAAATSKPRLVDPHKVAA
jgi:hypothetical protein